MEPQTKQLQNWTGLLTSVLRQSCPFTHVWFRLKKGAGRDRGRVGEMNDSVHSAQISLNGSQHPMPRCSVCLLFWKQYHLETLVLFSHFTFDELFIKNDTGIIAKITINQNSLITKTVKVEETYKCCSSVSLLASLSIFTSSVGATNLLKRKQMKRSCI